MSNDIQKADQIAYRFYTKLALVLANARQTNEPQSSRTQTKTDKWFNIETPDSDLYRDHLRTYRSISSSASSSSSSPSSSSPAPGTLVLDVLLAVPEHTGHATSHALVYHALDSSRVRVEPTRRFVLLQSWTLAFSPDSASSSPSISAASSAASSSSARTGDTSTTSSVYETEGGGSAAGGTEGGAVAPSTTYKHGIPLFRSLYTLLRILPAWRFFKLLRGRRMPGPNRNGFLGIELRVRGLDTPPPEDILDFDTRISPGHAPLPTSSHVFPSIPHPLGTLTLSTRYLDNPAFQLDSLESLLSSRFLSLDEGPEFTPTLARQSQSQSQSQSHLSSQQQAQQGATAAGLSRSPPRAYGAGAGAGGHPSSFPRTPVSGLARSPPKSPRSPLSASAAAIAEQFVIPRDRDRDRDRDTSMHARTVSVPEHHQQASGGQMGASPRAAAVPLTRTSTPGGAALGRGEGGGGASVLSVASSSRPESSAAWTGSRVGGAGAGGEDALSGLAARIRKESLGTRSSVVRFFLPDNRIRRGCAHPSTWPVTREPVQERHTLLRLAIAPLPVSITAAVLAARGRLTLARRRGGSRRTGPHVARGEHVLEFPHCILGHPRYWCWSGSRDRNGDWDWDRSSHDSELVGQQTESAVCAELARGAVDGQCGGRRGRCAGGGGGGASKKAVFEQLWASVCGERGE